MGHIILTRGQWVKWTRWPMRRGSVSCYLTRSARVQSWFHAWSRPARSSPIHPDLSCSRLDVTSDSGLHLHHDTTDKLSYWVKGLQCLDAVGWAALRASGLKKNEWWGAGMVICLQWGADLHMFQLMPLPLTVSCFSKIQTGFTILVLAHLGSPGKRPIKWVCVCACFTELRFYISSVFRDALPKLSLSQWLLSISA